MTALTQEVLKDMSLPSGSPPAEPTAPITDAEMTARDLARSVGTGQVRAVVTSRNGPFVMDWDVYYGDTKLGRIARAKVGLDHFYGFSFIDKTADNRGVRFTYFKDALRWVLLHAISIVRWEYHDRLLKTASVEGVNIGESQDITQFVQQSTGMHPRAGEVASKLRAWLESMNLTLGVRLSPVKGKKPEKPGLGYDWMSTANDTVLAIVLDYHENAFWLNNPGENKLKRFLRKEGLDLLKMDCTRWYVSERPKAVAEAMEPADLVNATKKPHFVRYKGIHTGDEGWALKIDYPESITQSQWAKISHIMNQKGYDSRGAADAQRAVYGFMQRFGRNLIPPVLNDWVDTVAFVLGVQAPSQPPKAKTAGATPASKVFRRAVKEWGVTHNPGLAGYILPNGALLDLSGANHGGGTNRAYDHRQVGQFFDEHFESPTDAMHAFMDMGAIRWMPESNGIDIRKPPTGQQLTAIRRILEHVHGEMIYVDVFWPNYGKAAGEYPGRTPAERIVRDIQTFYKTGQLPAMSDVQRAHLAAEEAVESLLTNETLSVCASYAARGTAAILLEAEQLELPLDSDDGEEGSPLSSEEIGAWLDKIGITKGYHQIDGDFGDPWKYGGTWFSAGIENDPNKWASIVHIDGLDTMGIEDYWSGSPKVKAAAQEPEWRAKIAHLRATVYHEDEDDERATDAVLDEIAEQMNEQRQVTTYRTNAEDPNEESWVTDGLAGMLSSVGLTHEQWLEMGPENRVCVAATYHGWDNFDSYPEKYTKAELSKFLGIEL